MPDFKPVFALRDNPFGPTEPIPGVKSRPAQGGLDSKPLLLAKEPELLALYCDMAGPFQKHFAHFKSELEFEGFDPPASAGAASFKVAVFGPRGTGKTTFAQRLAQHVMQCRPAGSAWQLREEFRGHDGEDPLRQTERIAAEEEALLRLVPADGYGFLLLDNIASARAYERALQLYEALQSKRVVVLVMTTSDRELFPRLGAQRRDSILAYPMSALYAKAAVEFVRHRVGTYRQADGAPDWLARHPLFPFDPEDIHEAFANGMTASGGDQVALRDFSVMVNRMLRSKYQELSARGVVLSALSEAEALRQCGIRVCSSYESLLAETT